MTKISTDRAQGERLAAIGFDPGTADLWVPEWAVRLFCDRYGISLCG